MLPFAGLSATADLLVNFNVHIFVGIWALAGDIQHLLCGSLYLLTVYAAVSEVT